MDASPLNLSPAPAGNSLASPATAGATPSTGGTGPGSFAGIFTSMHMSAERQNLAAWPEGLQMPSLVARPLGEGLSVITPDAPSPEQDSLLAFARSQGLDEQAIAALWQNAPGTSASANAIASATNSPTPTPDPSVLVSAATAATTTGPAPSPLLQAAMGMLLGAAHGTQPAPMTRQATTDNSASTSGTSSTEVAPAVPAFVFTPPAWANPVSTPAATPPTKPLATAQVLSTLPAMPATPAPLSTETTPLAPAASADSAELAAFAQAAQASPKPAAAQTLHAQAAAQMVDMALQPGLSPAAKTEPVSPAQPELDPLVLSQLKAQMTQQTLRPARPQTAQTPPPSDVTVPVWANPNPKNAEAEPQLLDLETDLTNLMSDAGTAVDAAQPATSSSPAAASATPAQANPSQSADTQAASAPRVISGFQLKTEHYQQLADRMGQMLAQRLQQQIDRGEWSLRLRLNPAELGQIDVQLDMQQGGLNAVFQADNPLTRDLIQQGSGRLKEGLAQSGMTVASVWVNSDGSRQSGGNPTPQDQRRHAQPQTAAQNASTPSTGASAKASDNNWDMLA